MPPGSWTDSLRRVGVACGPVTGPTGRKAGRLAVARPGRASASTVARPACVDDDQGQRTADSGALLLGHQKQSLARRTVGDSSG